MSYEWEQRRDGEPTSNLIFYVTTAVTEYETYVVEAVDGSAARAAVLDDKCRGELAMHSTSAGSNDDLEVIDVRVAS